MSLKGRGLAALIGLTLSIVAATVPASAAGAEASGLFVNSLIVLLREGFEAVIVVSALLAYLSSTGKDEMKRYLYGGIGAAVLGTGGVYVAASYLLDFSEAGRELLEGATMLLAVVVLFYVSHWLVAKAQAQRWQSYVQEKVDHATSRGSGLTLGLLGFAVVFREGFETVLFYQALYLDAGVAGGIYVTAGAVAGAVALVFVYVGLRRFSYSIPTEKFFAVTSAFLYYLAFKFAGEGVHAMQEAGYVAESEMALSVPPMVTAWFGVRAYVETMAAQSLLLLAIVAGLVYVMVLKSEPEPVGEEEET